MSAPVFILGSSSASRLSILRSAGVAPVCISPDVDEDAILAGLFSTSPERPHAEDGGISVALAATAVHALAEAKAKAVAASVQSFIAELHAMTTAKGNKGSIADNSTAPAMSTAPGTSSALQEPSHAAAAPSADVALKENIPPVFATIRLAEPAHAGDIPPASAAALRSAIASGATTACIIAADSMLLIDGTLQGKPHTVDAAIKRWTTQAGKVAHLVTGHAEAMIDLRSGEITFPTTSDDTVAHTADGRLAAQSPELSSVPPHIALRTSTTRIHFAHPSREDIEAYAQSGEPLPCAGAFTLEALGGWFIDRIEGDPSGVIGLSLPVIRRLLYRAGIPAVSTLWNRVQH